MGYPRKSLICLADTPYYHVVARCVRRAWLWGYDAYAGKDYSHRKSWILQRLACLSDIFAIDLCAYAIMSNHYHLVLRVDRERSTRWTSAEIVKRWTRVFGQPPLIKRWQDGSANSAERAAAEQLIECWRSRLIDVSWYMRCLNEHLARRANAEDECTGRFWEGRFKSQALLDEAGLLTAMVYVDLNPVRARIAAIPEESEFTSIYARIRQHAAHARTPRSGRTQAQPRVRLRTPPLIAFRDTSNRQHPTLPMCFSDYLQLVEWTGRMTRTDKPGVIKQDLPPILTRLHINPEVWQWTMTLGGNSFGRALGTLEQLRSHAKRLGQSWVKGLQVARRLYCRA
jgi:REP element-mobilizing transposase RayT